MAALHQAQVEFKQRIESLRAASVKLKRQFSVGFLGTQVLLICVGLGLLTIPVHARINIEGQFLVLPLVGACWGAAIGSFWNSVADGAKAGLLVGYVLLMLCFASLTSR
jgi:hypothetical protein